MSSSQFNSNLFKKFLKKKEFNSYMINNNIYSEEEIIIGYIIKNGKKIPIYRRMFITTSPNSLNNETIVAKIGSFASIINFNSNVDISPYGIIPLPQAVTTNNFNCISIDNKTDGNITMTITNNAYKSKPLIIYVEYTKTTD